jgi:predicted metal-dependent hydrolase
VTLFSPKPSYAHGDRLVLDGHSVRLRVDARARRVSLRIDQARREVIATAPTARALGDAVAFARTRAVWIATQLVRLPEPQSHGPGSIIQVAGEPCRLEIGTVRGKLVPATEDEPMRILAPEGERFWPTVIRLLKAEAKRQLTEASNIHANALGKPAPVVSIMDAKGRWGSCTPARTRLFGGGNEAGRIRYSWRLILSPPEVMDYVAAHECAHLVEANHGPNFWALVKDLVGDERPHRKWLRHHGAALHSFGA